MTDPPEKSLKTASTYINNLLLARGLLRNGKSIDFAKPSSSSASTAIINLVHDLILRRDKEAAHLSQLAATLTALRTETTRKDHTLAVLETRVTELTRSVSQAEVIERSLRTQLKTAAAEQKAQTQEVARAKATLAQVRAQCANDVRKRDVQIQKLKTHLAGQQSQRGAPTRGVGMSNGTISVTGGSKPAPRRDDDDDGLDVLEKETNEYLVEITRKLGSENEELRNMVGRVVEDLRELLGLKQQQAVTDEEGQTQTQIVSLVTPTTPIETISEELQVIFEHLRTILTNPNFVPIDEVEVREDEIIRLREGWERMEGRWRDLLSLMNRWRAGGKVDIEELTLQLEIDNPREDSGFQGDDAALPEDDALSDDDELDAEDDIDEALEEPELEDQLGPKEHGLSEEEPSESEPTPRVLSPRTANSARRPTAPTPSARRVSFATDTAFSPIKVPLKSNPRPATPGRRGSLLQQKLSNPPSKRRSTSPAPGATSPSRSAKARKTTTQASPRTSLSPAPTSRTTTISIEAKLAAAAEEAAEAVALASASPKKRRKSLRGNANGTPYKPRAAAAKENLAPADTPDDEESVDWAAVDADVDPVEEKKDVVPPAVPAHKRTRIPTAARKSRRRSTLSPQELERLMLGGGS